MSKPADFRVTLLGTGVPTPRPERFGPSTLIEAGNRKLLIDAGRGATIRLYQLGIPIGRIDALLLTHFHSDHTVGIPDLWLTGWLKSHYATRTVPFRVIGPTGTKDLMENLQRAYAADIRIRVVDEALDPKAVALSIREFEADSIVFHEDDLRVTAFEVDHGDWVKPAYGYRIQYQDRVVVLSGDTRYNDNVIKHSIGADLLIHEVASARQELLSEPHVQRILAHHTSPYEAGEVFAKAKPRMAAFTHLVLVASATVPPPTLEAVAADTRLAYDGPLVIGEDLMSFDIADQIHVSRLERSIV